MVSKEGMLVDSTIVKADASLNSLIEVNLSPEEYWKKLDNKERPKKKLVGEHFSGKVDKNKMGKEEEMQTGQALEKNQQLIQMQLFFINPV